MNMNIGLFGLGGNHSDMIIGVVHLKLFEGNIVVPPPTNGGGTIISNIPYPTYDLDDEDDYPTHKRIEVNIRVRMGTFWYDRDFWVLPKTLKVVVSATDLVNTSKSNMRVVVSTVRSAFQAIGFAVKRITNKNKTDGNHND